MTAPYRVEPSQDSKMFPWCVVGPEGLVSGHPEERAAQREARQWNKVYALGRQSAVSERREWLLWDGAYDKKFYDVWLGKGDVVIHCWPNAGKMCATDGSGREWSFSAEAPIAVRESEWQGGPPHFPSRYERADSTKEPK